MFCFNRFLHFYEGFHGRCLNCCWFLLFFILIFCKIYKGLNGPIDGLKITYLYAWAVSLFFFLISNLGSGQLWWIFEFYLYLFYVDNKFIFIGRELTSDLILLIKNWIQVLFLNFLQKFFKVTHIFEEGTCTVFWIDRRRASGFCDFDTISKKNFS